MQQEFELPNLQCDAAQAGAPTMYAPINDDGSRESQPGPGGVLAELREALSQGGPHQ